MPWRRDPLFVTTVFGPKALGLPMLGDRASIWKRNLVELNKGPITARFRLIRQIGNRATVRVSVNNKLQGYVYLRQPLGYWWYITSVRRVAKIPRETAQVNSNRSL